jgi:16S rRNA (cytidine1402-2'-O)-methyltransferase
LPGKLFLVATPIGNLGDITPRTKSALEESDFILAEDTRVSIKILNHLEIKKRLISCHDHNESGRVELIEQAASESKTIALVCDAGTPLVSDPGYVIVQAAIRAGMTIVPIPGPSASLLALIASGLPANKFVFEGFLPEKPSALKQRLTELKDETRTTIFYISPHKLEKTLTAIREVLGNRKACLARELTKLHEEFIRTDLDGILEVMKARTLLGEYVLVIAGAEVLEHRIDDPAQLDIVNAEIEKMLAGGMGVKEISQECVKKFGWKRSKIYELAVRLSQQKATTDEHNSSKAKKA